ncbi:MAG: hypothetical protein JWR37_2898 [Mycobacterium sp.]|nr:hypothetical protein [Mycobacterium sp.]
MVVRGHRTRRARRSPRHQFERAIPCPNAVWTRPLDGEYVWGSIDTWPSRHGVRRYRLVLFPPGVTRGERRTLRLSRAWLTWDAVLFLLSEIFLSSALAPGAALAVSAAVYLGPGAVLFARAGALRARMRTLSVYLVTGYRDPRSAAIYAELESLFTALCAADVLCFQDRITATDHEAVWWRVYDQCR